MLHGKYQTVEQELAQHKSNLARLTEQYRGLHQFAGRQKTELEELRRQQQQQQQSYVKRDGSGPHHRDPLLPHGSPSLGVQRGGERGGSHGESPSAAHVLRPPPSPLSAWQQQQQPHHHQQQQPQPLLSTPTHSQSGPQHSPRGLAGGAATTTEASQRGSLTPLGWSQTSRIVKRAREETGAVSSSYDRAGDAAAATAVGGRCDGDGQRPSTVTSSSFFASSHPRGRPAGGQSGPVPSPVTSGTQLVLPTPRSERLLYMTPASCSAALSRQSLGGGGGADAINGAAGEGRSLFRLSTPLVHSLNHVQQNHRS